MNFILHTTCSRRGARHKAYHLSYNSCISSPTLIGLCAIFLAELPAPCDAAPVVPNIPLHLRSQVWTPCIMIIFRLLFGASFFYCHILLITGSSMIIFRLEFGPSFFYCHIALIMYFSQFPASQLRPSLLPRDSPLHPLHFCYVIPPPFHVTEIFLSWMAVVLAPILEYQFCSRSRFFFGGIIFKSEKMFITESCQKYGS